jgi:hypothetical protein
MFCMDVAGRWRNSYRLCSLDGSNSHVIQHLHNIDRFCKSVRNILQTENAGCAGKSKTRNSIVVVVVVVVVIAVAAAAAVVYPPVPLTAQSICELSPSHSVKNLQLTL